MRGAVRGESGMGLVAVIGLDRMCDLNAGDRYSHEGRWG
jgi:hypothetical protein